MFSKIKQKIYTLEVVIDALLNILHDKDVVTRSEMQIEILKNEMKEQEVDDE